MLNKNLPDQFFQEIYQKGAYDYAEGTHVMYNLKDYKSMMLKELKYI